MTGDTSEVDDETKENETGEGDDLDKRKPEFDFSEPLDTETIDSDDKLDIRLDPLSLEWTYGDKDSDPGGTVDIPVPESNDESTSDDLIRTDDQVLAEVDEGGGETESGVDTSSSVSSESLLGWESGRHFSQS